jgi:hypothetical protein
MKEGKGREGKRRVLSSLKVGGVALLNDWLPSIKPYSLGTTVALNPLLNGFIKEPLMRWVHSCSTKHRIPAGIPRNPGFRAPARPIPHIITKYRKICYSSAYVAFVPYTGWTGPLGQSQRSPALEFQRSGQEFRYSAPAEPQELPECLPEFPAKL